MEFNCDAHQTWTHRTYHTCNRCRSRHVETSYTVEDQQRAMENFELFHGMERGSVDLQTVARSSAGVRGWVAYVHVENWSQEEVP